MAENNDEPSSIKRTRISKTLIVAGAILLVAFGVFLVPTVASKEKSSPRAPESQKTVYQPEPDHLPDAPKVIKPDYTDEEYTKELMAEMVLDEGGDQEDVRILEEIIRCESHWQQFWEPNNYLNKEPGTVKISKGNVGFGQLNRGTWEQFFIKNFDLDIYEAKDNLEATVILYLWQGIEPWEPWSGHCFVPPLRAEGLL